MGYTELDTKAINTIRLLAVRPPCYPATRASFAPPRAAASQMLSSPQHC